MGSVSPRHHMGQLLPAAAQAHQPAGTVKHRGRPVHHDPRVPLHSLRGEADFTKRKAARLGDSPFDPAGATRADFDAAQGAQRAAQ